MYFALWNKILIHNLLFSLPIFYAQKNIFIQKIFNQISLNMLICIGSVFTNYYRNFPLYRQRSMFQAFQYIQKKTIFLEFTYQKIIVSTGCRKTLAKSLLFSHIKNIIFLVEILIFTSQTFSFEVSVQNIYYSYITHLIITL